METCSHSDMVTTLSLLLAISSTSPTWSIPPARVQYGAPRFITHLWPNSTRDWAVAAPFCMAWGGTAATFAMAPLWNKPQWRPWIKAAAVTTLAGIIGTMVAVSLTPDPATGR